MAFSCAWAPLTTAVVPRPLQAEAPSVDFSHILVALCDSNPNLSSSSRSALVTAAALAERSAEGRLTVLLVDEQGRQVDESRMRMVQSELQK